MVNKTILEELDNDPEDTLLDRVLGVVDDQLLSLQDICDLLEIEEKELLERFKDRVVDCKEKFGIYDDTTDVKEVLDDDSDVSEEG